VGKSSIDSDVIRCADRPLDLGNLVQWFFPVKKNRLIGLEIEYGLSLADGSAVTLETGGAIEYSSPPEKTLTECISRAKRAWSTLREWLSGWRSGC
jgi:hypothetical protein